MKAKPTSYGSTQKKNLKTGRSVTEGEINIPIGRGECIGSIFWIYNGN
jgi:hypothetical protein